jgi:hypothetical protein
MEGAGAHVVRYPCHPSPNDIDVSPAIPLCAVRHAYARDPLVGTMAVGY